MKRLNRRKFMATSALAMLYGASPAWLRASSTTASSASATVPWRNWSRALEAHPAGRFAATSEEHLAQFLASTQGAVRPVGSGH